MNGLSSVYGNLGAQLLGLANADRASNTNAQQLKRGGSPSPSPLPFGADWGRAPFQGGGQLAAASRFQSTAGQSTGANAGDDEYEDEVIEEMGGGWAQPSGATATSSSSAKAAGGVVPRLDSVELTKMEEGPDDENPTNAEQGDLDDDDAQRSLRKRKRKSLSTADDDKGKKRLSCIDCGCRAALKACAKIMCIDCCAKEGRVCDAHAKKLYEKEVRKLELSMPGGGSEKEPKDKDGSPIVGGPPSSAKSGKKRVRVRSAEGENKQTDQDDAEDGFPLAEEDSDDATPERRDLPTTEQNDDAAKAKRSGVLYETIMKQDKKIRALQNDLKELRTLLLSVVDKQSAFTRQLRHLSGGASNDGLVIDEDEEADDEDRL